MKNLHPATGTDARQRNRGMNPSTRARIVAKLADPEFRNSVPGRVLYLSHRYGIPLIEMGLYLGVGDRTVHRWLAGSKPQYSTARAETVALKLAALEQSAQFLDEKHFRPRTWREALALCEAQLTRQE